MIIFGAFIPSWLKFSKSVRHFLTCSKPVTNLTMLTDVYGCSRFESVLPGSRPLPVRFIFCYSPVNVAQRTYNGSPDTPYRIDEVDGNQTKPVEIN